MQEKKVFTQENEAKTEPEFAKRQDFNLKDLEQAQESQAEYTPEANLLKASPKSQANLNPGKFFTWSLRILSLFVLALGLNTLYQLGGAIYALWQLFTGGLLGLGLLVSHLSALAVQLGLLGIFIALALVLRREYTSIKNLQEHEQKQLQAGIVLSAYAKVEDKNSGKASLTHHQGQIYFTNAEQAILWCYEQIGQMQINSQHPAIKEWEKAVHSYMSPGQVLQLFSFYVLEPFDKQVLQLVHKRAATDALVIAFSHFALLDMLFIAWRNLKLMHEISELYGVKLGYYARLKLFKHLVVNVFVAGATEAVDLSDYVSSNLLAKLSTRAAQGLSLGLLSTRLGIKCMEFARPLPFGQKNRPNVLQLGKSLSQQILQSFKEKE